MQDASHAFASISDALRADIAALLARYNANQIKRVLRRIERRLSDKDGPVWR